MEQVGNVNYQRSIITCGNECEIGVKKKTTPTKHRFKKELLLSNYGKHGDKKSLLKHLCGMYVLMDVRRGPWAKQKEKAWEQWRYKPVGE